jgi:hypothetical protein
MFELDRTSHRENIAWVAQEKLFSQDYEPSVAIDVEGILNKRAQVVGQDIDWHNSIVDLMKVFGLDSSLGARKRLAQQLGYNGALNGSEEMNTWLHQRVMGKFRESGGRVPEGLQGQI